MCRAFLCLKHAYDELMKKLILILLSVYMALFVPAKAGDAVQNPLQMDNIQLSATFSGMTMTGKYADDITFTETYHANGSITYQDDLSTDKGRWFVRGNLLCTFYEISNGACFSVQKSGDNCYEYFVEQTESGNLPPKPGAWISIGWDQSKPSTCDLAPKVT